MRGFITVIVILAIFLVSITMLNVSYQQTETISFKEELLNEKMMFTNYELAMNRAMKGQNLVNVHNEGGLDGNSAEILNMIKSPFTTCVAIVDDATITSSKASIDLSCTTQIRINEEPTFLSTYSKPIVVER